jgi:hypothetical protein
MTYYISITGIELKSAFHLPRFGDYATQSMQQAQAAAGNISASSNYVNGVHHTLSVWDDRKSMTRFKVSGAHAQAMKVEPEFSLPGNTKVYGYESEHIPSWDEAIAIWVQHGRRHGGKVVPKAAPS